MRKDYNIVKKFKYVPVDTAFNILFGKKRKDKNQILNDFTELRHILENEKHNYFDFANFKKIITTK